MSDPWLIGSHYERYVGRWSRLVARELIAWLDIPTGSSWLDVGCGTGSLGEAVVHLANPARVVGVDRSTSFLRHARATVSDASFAAADAASLPFANASFDVAVCGLVLNFLPDPVAAASELRRVARRSVGAYVWDYAGAMQLLRRFWDVAVALDPATAALDEGRRFPMCTLPGLVDVLTRAGLRDVAGRAIEVPTVFHDFDDLWEPFLGGQGPAPGYVARLDEAARARLRERLRATLEAEPDGSIRLVARAWAARART